MSSGEAFFGRIEDPRLKKKKMLVKPRLAETQLRVEVRRLKCVKYELHKTSSPVDTLLLRDLLDILPPGPPEGVHTTRRYRDWE